MERNIRSYLAQSPLSVTVKEVLSLMKYTQQASPADWNFFGLWTKTRCTPRSGAWTARWSVEMKPHSELADFGEKSQDSSKLSRTNYFFRLSFKINVLPCRQQTSDNDVRTTQATFPIKANLCFYSYDGRLRKPPELTEDHWRLNDIIRNRAALLWISRLPPQAP